MLPVFDTGIVSLTNNYVSWRIDNFHSLSLSVGSEISSPQFLYGDSRYTLVIWPRGRKGFGSEGWFGIHLYKYDAPGTISSVQFSIVSNLGEIRTCTAECSENNIFRQDRFIEWLDFRALAHRILPNGCLNILCKIPVENSAEGDIKGGNVAEIFTRPLNDPVIKFQSGEHHSPDPRPIESSIKVKCPDEQKPAYVAPNSNTGPLSTINSFFSTSSFENSFENIPDSAEMRNSEFKMAHVGTTPESSLWSSFTGDFFLVNKRDRSDANQNLTKDNAEESAPDTAPDPKTVPPKVVESAENAAEAEVTISNYTNTNPLPNTENKCTSSTVQNSNNAVVESGEEVESQSTTLSPHASLSSAHSLEDYGINMASNSINKIEKHFDSAVPYPKGLKTLSLDLRELYLDGKVFDLTIIMEGKDFKVLRGILIARSPYFKQLLSEEAGETAITIISIDPFSACDSSVLHEFLLYIYSGEIENLSYKNLCGLYCAATKFGLPELKEESALLLKMSLSIDTITDIVRLINDESELLDMAIVFLAKNMEVIMTTDEWKQFMRDEPDRAIGYHLKALKIGYTKTIV